MNNNWKIFLLEFKRTLAKFSTLLMAAVFPVILISAISLSLLPIFFDRGGINTVNVSVYYEDSSPEVLVVGKALTEHKAARNFLNVIEVGSIEEGISLIEGGETSVFVHIPADMVETLYTGGTVNVKYYFGDRDRELSTLIYEIFNNGVNLINYAQQSVDLVYENMEKLGYSYEERIDEYLDSGLEIYTSVINKYRVFADSMTLSLISEYLPIEYYSITMLILSLFFCATPLLVMFNRDIVNGTLSRCLFAYKKGVYLFIRVCVGAIFLGIQMTLSIPLILLQNKALSLFSGDVGLIFLSAIFAGLYFSSTMLLVASIAKDSNTGLWLGLTYTLFVSLISGLIVPASILPDWLTVTAQITGLPSVFKMFSAALFGISARATAINFAICISVTVINFVFLFFILKRRKV